MVTSPGGTAAAGLAEMERRGVRGAIIDGVTAAMRQGGRARVNISTIEQFLYSLWLVYSLVIALYILTSWLQLPPTAGWGRCGRFSTTPSSPSCARCAASCRRWEGST